MTETPTLNYKEQKKALSSRIKKRKKSIKSILTFKSIDLRINSVPDGELATVGDALQSLLQAAKLPEMQISWSELKNLKKDERRVKRESILSNIKSEFEDKKRERKKYLFGVNAVTRSINKGSVSAVLLAEDVQPRQLINHIIFLSKTNRVPCVLYSQLRSVTKNSLGFPCIALGFKSGFKEFEELIKKIQEFCEFVDTSDVSIVTEVEEKEKINDPEKHSNASIVNSIALRQNVYKYRKDKDARAFVPASSKTEKEEEFIRISDDISDVISANELSLEGISLTVIEHKNESKEKLKKKKFKGKRSFMMGSVDDDEIPEVEVKKSKQWIIDTQGKRETVMYRTKAKYEKPTVVRVESNPDRKAKKNIKKSRE